MPLGQKPRNSSSVTNLQRLRTLKALRFDDNIPGSSLDRQRLRGQENFEALRLSYGTGGRERLK